MSDDCPTCNGRRWIVRLGRWIATRETVDMVCPTCGTDYSTTDARRVGATDPGDGR